MKKGNFKEQLNNICPFFNRYFICLLICLSNHKYCFSQTARVDSLKNLLGTLKEDSNKVNLLNDIAFELRDNNPEKAYEYAGKALTLAKDNKFSLGQGKSLIILGTASMNLGKLDRAIDELNKGIVICKKTGNQQDESRAYNNIGNAYSGKGNFAAALKSHLESLKIKKSLGNKRGMANSYNSIGGVYINLGAYDKAISYYTESLKIRQELNDKAGIAQCYANLGIIYSNKGNYEMALERQFEALKISKEFNLKIQTFMTYDGIGVSYASQGKYEEALKYYFAALDMKDVPDDPYKKASVYNSIGAAYDFLGNYPKALEYFLVSLELREQIKDQAGIAQTVFNIGHIYQKQNKYGEALKKYSEALEIEKKTGDKRGLAQSYYAIGLTYHSQGNDTAALTKYKEALKIFEEIGDARNTVDTRNSVGVIFQAQHNYSAALKNYFSAFELSKKINNKAGIARSQLNIAYAYQLMGDIVNAKKYLNNGLVIAKETKERELLMTYYANMSQIDSIQSLSGINSPEEKEGYWKSAYENYKQAAQYKDSMFSIDTSRQLSEMLTKYETGKKEKEILMLQKDQKIHIAEMRRQKLIRNSIVAGAVLFLLSSFFISFFYKRKRDADQKQKETALNLKVSETEMKSLRSQMNPHFIFNALQSIQTFLMSHKPEEANTYLLKFSKLMRLVLENSEYPEVPVKEDIQALELYMQLESIRLQHPFTYQINVDNTIDPESDTIPPLILQPFVENAIWHGLQYKPVAGHIDILLLKKENILYAIVTDNGVGRNNAQKHIKPIFSKHQSLGIKLTQDRLNTLNETRHINAGFTITDLFDKEQNPAGTKVELSLPLG